MNASVTDYPVNLRLDRIRIISGVAKYVCFAVLIYAIGFYFWRPSYSMGGMLHFDPRWLAVVLMVALQAGFWYWCRKLYHRPRFQNRVGLAIFIAIVQFLLLMGYWQFLGTPPFSTGSWYALLMLLLHLVTWFWYWKLARLFRFFERGSIFTAETIRCIRTLGLLCVVGWLLGSALHFFPNPAAHSVLTPAGRETVLHPAAHTQVAGPASPVVIDNRNEFPRLVARRSMQLGFFSFDFGTGINFGLLFTGLSIALVAWILDEGRKIQEEQSLTV